MYNLTVSRNYIFAITDVVVGKNDPPGGSSVKGQSATCSET